MMQANLNICTVSTILTFKSDFLLQLTSSPNIQVHASHSRYIPQKSMMPKVSEIEVRNVQEKESRRKMRSRDVGANTYRDQGLEKRWWWNGDANNKVRDVSKRTRRNPGA